MIFRDYAPQLYKNDFSIFWAKGKRPLETNWQSYRDHQPSEEIFDLWLERHPNENIGLPMGPFNGCVAFDLDFGKLFDYSENHAVLNQWAELIANLLPVSPFTRRGRKFWAKLYRFSGQLGGSFSVNGVPIGDFITQGQIIIPPSIHPDTGEPYVWTGGCDLKDFGRDTFQDMLQPFTEIDFVKFKAELALVIKPEMITTWPEIKKRETATGVKSTGEGRNNDLKREAGRLFDLGFSDTDAAVELIAIDQELFGANALFSDASEFKREKTPESRASRFTANMFKAFSRAREKSGEAMPVPRNDRVSRPKAKSEHYEPRGFTQVAYSDEPPDWHDEIPHPEAEYVSTTDDILYPSMVDGFHVYDRRTEKWIPQFEELAQYMKNELGLRFRNGYCFIFDQTHFVQISDDQVRQRIDQLTLRTRGPTVVQNFFKATVYKCTLPKSAFESPDGFLNCANGVLRISDRMITPHSKAVFFNYVLPHAYDASATCDKWKLFLFETFNGNLSLSDLIAEMFGYVIEGGNPWLHKAFFLVGSGRNGKGVVSEVLKALIGRENFSAVPIQKLEKEFSAVMLDGKLANIVTELSTEAAQSDIFKTVVAGEPITVSEKNKPQYLLIPHCRTVILANQLPRFNDPSTGVVDRLCIIPFDNYIAEDKRDPQLASKLIAEISGVLNWTLDGLASLHARGHLPQVEAVSEKLTEYREESDSIYAYFAANFVDNSDHERHVRMVDLYPFYESWCSAEHRNPKSLIAFGRGIAEFMRKHPKSLTWNPTKPGNKVAFKGYFRFEGTPVILQPYSAKKPIKMNR